MKISVCIVTYNHKEFISQAIESVLSQKTNFPFEILIGEDASTDGTREICEKYAKKNPDKIRLFLRSRENVIYINGNPTGRYNFIETLKQAKGKYIALLDGDDYWTDPLKLQKQVGFLEANEDFSVCFHKVKILKDSYIGNDNITTVPKKITTLEDLSKGNYIQTCSSVFRASLLVLPDWFNHKINAGDYPIHLILAQKGKLFYFEDAMGVYRIHDSGLYSGANQEVLLRGNIYLLKTLRDNFKEKNIKANFRLQLISAINGLLFIFFKNKKIKKASWLLFINIFIFNRQTRLAHFKNIASLVIKRLFKS